MKLVQKLLSHGLLITFFVAVFFVYLYRGELFPQWFGEQAQSVAARSKPATQQEPLVAQTAPKQGRAPVPAPAGQPEQDTDAGQAMAQAPGTESELPPMASQSQDSSELPPMGELPPRSESLPPLSSAGGSTAVAVGGQEREVVPPVAYRPGEEAEVTASAPETTAQPPAAEPAVSEVPPPPVYRPLQAEREAVDTQPVADAAAPAQGETVAPPVYRPLEPQRGVAPTAAESVAAGSAASELAPPAAGSPQPEQSEAPPATITPAQTQTTAQQPASPPASDYQAQLDQARQYFWNRDTEAALAAYEALARTYQQSAEVWGELGNLYFNIGHRQAAAASFYQAGRLLIDNGDVERAYGLLQVMYGLDREKASELESRLRQVRR